MTPKDTKTNKPQPASAIKVPNNQQNQATPPKNKPAHVDGTEAYLTSNPAVGVQQTGYFHSISLKLVAEAKGKGGFANIVVLSLLLFSAPSLAQQDWASILHAVANMPNRPDPINAPAEQQYLAAAARLSHEDVLAAQKEIVVLNTLYQNDPTLRFQISLLLAAVAADRNVDGTDALKPILPTLITHLSDPDVKAREGVTRAIALLRPQPPSEALDTLINLSRAETQPENVSIAIWAVSRYCKTSKAAVLALRDAASADQPNMKRLFALQSIGQTNCTDSELVDALADGLKSDQSNVVATAAQAAARFGPAAERLKPELQRIAAGQGQAAEAARRMLEQLRQQR